jgi:uridine kinase
MSLDGWLKAADERHEGIGVLGRYELDGLIQQVKQLVLSATSLEIDYLLHDRKLKQIKKSKKISIGPSDIVILEGVPALLDPELFDLASLSIHVDVDDDVRMRRLQEEYLWREERQEEFMQKIMSREVDEVSLVKSVANKANYQINF